ncbi:MULTISPECIES: radical SAM family heme chaperone HemW [unclassified Caulobacter]|uniref:radical SAM family heme chaperone HemW n=1 Tax=unclassified Caulobacter TaxID=2648921 RepID=UPI000D334BF8|nr:MULTISPECIES: radical SAM family heme chaperone HemW [unclassified Caulobacter]PTS90682.1 coproporphyrinogen III oxidase [Caulobacter sp. HMWF009]PTT13094.1 coproporphyrinogen III oxidase [Caulobacter sp. HMWF025]
MTEPGPPLGVYIHWPYCARICPYCDFNVVRDRGRTAEQQDLADAIVADLTAQRARTGPRTLLSIFFGGGTPSLMDPVQVARVIATAGALWTPAPDLEISLEANPTDAEAGRFEALAAAGVARLSLGVQSLQDEALVQLGRNHDAGSARRALALAARVFPRLSVDLIYARPGQSDRDWRDELDAVLAFAPEHVSPYQLTIEAGTAFDRAVGRGRLVVPDEDLATTLFETTQAVLEGAGFEAYEVSNHARGEAARSRHNLVYWRGHDYVGVGPGAHGRLTLSGGRIATTAHRKIADYVAAVRESGVGFEAEALSSVEAAEERLLLGLRIDAGVAFDEVAVLGLAPGAAKVRRHVELGLLADDPSHLRATRAGRLVLDRLTGALAT